MHIEFRLLANALDYVLSAAEHAKADTPRDLKYAILHLAAGVELLVKARLEKEHWSLLFSDVDKADEAAIKSGDFKSVEADAAWKRLERVARVNIPLDMRKRLDALRRIRNQVQHFAISIAAAEVRILVGGGHSFVLDFVREELADEVAPYEDQLEQIRVELTELEAFVAARLLDLKPRIDAADRALDCPICSNETLLVIDDHQPRRVLCEKEFDWEELAQYGSEGGDVVRCPDCDTSTCTLVVFSNEDAGWYCIRCDQRFGSEGGRAYTTCPRCNDGVVKAGDGVCAACWKDVMDRD